MTGRQKNKKVVLAKLFLNIGFVGVIGMSLPASSSAQTPAVQAPPLVAFTPGLWEVKQRMSGGPMGGQEQTRTTCMTAETLASSTLGPMRPTPPQRQGGMGGMGGRQAPAAGREAPNCNLSDLVNQAGAISYQSACPTPMGSMNSRWQGTADAQQFAVTGEARIMGRKIRSQVQGRRTGDCPPA
jgi:hypothetical protein